MVLVLVGCVGCVVEVGEEVVVVLEEGHRRYCDHHWGPLVDLEKEADCHVVVMVM